MKGIANFKRTDIYRRDDWRCHYCRLTVIDARTDYMHANNPRRATLDHKHPLSRGGTWHPDNLVTCCSRCNSEKAAIPYEHYRWFRHMLMRGHSRDELLLAIEENLAEDQLRTESFESHTNRIDCVRTVMAPHRPRAVSA